MQKQSLRKYIREIGISGLLLILGFAASFSFAEQITEEDTLFGPVTALRSAGKPNEYTFNFTKLPGFEPPYRLIVTNGGTNGENRVSSASVSLNGKKILGPNKFNKNVETITHEVDLVDSNKVFIKIASSPGSFIKLMVLGQKLEEPEQVLEQSQTTIGPAGGRGVLGNFATVTLPEAPTRPDLNLTLQKVTAPLKRSLYEGETLFVGPSLAELLKITSSEDMAKSVGVTIQVPPSFVASLPSGYRLELFAEFVQIGAGDETISTFEPLGATYDPLRNVAYANVPSYAFTPTNSVTTYIVVGSYQGAPTSTVTGQNIVPSEAVTATPDQSLPLAADLTFSIPPQVGNPLKQTLVINDNFGPRIHPLTQQESFHNGVDLDTNSQPVYPMAGGTVTRSGPQVPCPNVVNGVCQTGFGHRVWIDHGNGLTSVYGHMEPDGLPPVGSTVTTNTVIGTSDSTGLSSGDHLHTELRLNGAPVNPLSFIEQQDAQGYLEDLSVVALVNGEVVEATRQNINPSSISGNTAQFLYSSLLDLVPLQLPGGSSNQLSIVVQNANGTSTDITTVPLSIDPLPLRVTLTWGTNDTDVDLHVRDSNGNESWYANLCGIPNGCLDRDDVDGFGPEVFDLKEMDPNVTYTVFIHYFSDHGNGPTTTTVLVEQGTQTFGPFTRILSNDETTTIGVFPQ